MKTSIVIIALTTGAISGCAVNDDYRAQNSYRVEQTGYATVYGGTTWYRDDMPYRVDYDRNRIPDNREADRYRNGTPDHRAADRNRNGIPDNREPDRNRNGIPDNREYDRNRNGVPDRKDHDREGKSGRNTDRDGDGVPDNKERRPGNFNTR